MLQPISNYYGLNLPGAIFIEYAPVEWINVEAWEGWTVSGNQVTDIPWKTEDYDWLRMPFLNETIRWNETSRLSANGTVYPQKLSGTTPNLRVEVSEVIEEHERYERYILKLKDRNGKTWIIGTPETPMTFGAEASLDGNSYTISFEGEATRRAKGFVPTL